MIDRALFNVASISENPEPMNIHCFFNRSAAHACRSARAIKSGSLWAAALLLTAFIPAAQAELGSVPTWTTASNASTSLQQTRQMAATTVYSLDETTLSTGTVVREYVNASNVVFAITWSGPHPPPLNTLLGSSYMSTLTTGLAAVRKARGGGVGRATVEQSGLIVQLNGHMGAYAGRAYLPAALPSGFAAKSIR